MRTSLFILTALFFTGVAQAEPMQMAPGQSMEAMHKDASKPTAQHSMDTMTMEQQMAVCSKIETLQKQGKALNPTMQQQKAACGKMDGSMDAPAQPAPDATLER